MVGRDDIVVLYYNGIRHTFRISERFGFLTALDEEMRRCALVIDKTKKMEEIPASDFEVMEDPVYSFEANERVLNYTLLDSFELHESLVAKNVMKMESDEEGEQEQEQEQEQEGEEKEKNDNDVNCEHENENEIENEIENESEIEIESENASEIAKDGIAAEQRKGSKNQIEFDQPNRESECEFEKKREITNEPEDEPAENHFLYVNNTAIQAVIRHEGKAVVIRHIPLKNIFQITANQSDHSLIFKYEYKSKVCHCCYHCNQVFISLAFLILSD